MNARVKRYEPCYCEGSCEQVDVNGRSCEPNFRCAVHEVILMFGVDPNCDCRTTGKKFCGYCIAEAWYEEGISCPTLAFQDAMPPYHDLAETLSVEAMSGFKDRDRGIEKILSAADTDPIAYDTALAIVAGCIMEGEPVPKAMREWAWSAVKGLLERPFLKSKIRYARERRDKTIVQMVELAAWKFRLKPTAAGDEGGESACAAVAEALRILRLQPDSYSSIRRIWINRNSEPELPDWAR